ncbi:MAG TPA: tetratricopeptide repeat protein [Lacibacter sp.]|nr:tetratricopeptide repeat protein [Lacibacter sp.]
MRLLVPLFLLLTLTVSAQDTIPVDRRGLPQPTADTTTPVTGENYALVVGISNYKYLKPLNYADYDAQLFADFLRTKAGGSIKNENLVLLKNDSAKSGYFWASFTKLASRLKKGDRFYFYFAGHGDAAKEMNEYFLLLQDCEPANDPNNYLAGTHTIQVYNLKNRIGVLTRKGVEVVLILDACRTNELPGGYASQAFNSNIAQSPVGEIMMLATGAGEVSIESPLIGNGHGLFTFYLIDGLSGLADKEDGNNNGEVTLAELQDWVRRKVRMKADAQFRTRQVPYFCCGDKDNASLVKVDTAFFEQWSLSKNASNSSEPLAINKVRSAQGTTLRDTTIIALYNRFTTAVKNLKLWGSNASAAALYDSMRAVYPAHTLTEEAGFNLAAQFINFTQQKINLYLAAKDESIITQSLSPETQDASNEIISSQLKRQLKISSVNWAETAAMYEKAIELLAAYDSTARKNMLPNLYFLKARQLVFSNAAAEKKQALAFAYRAYNYDRSKAYIVHTLGLSLSENNKYDSALIIEKAALQLAPKWSYVLHAIGLNYYELHQPDSAIAYLREAIRINPKSELPYSGMGFVYEEMDKTDSSLYYYKAAIRINPQYEFQYNNLGVFYAKLNSFDSAVYYYKQALLLNPSYEYAVNNLAIAFEKWKKFDSAMVYYKKAHQLNPNNEKLYTQLARIYLNGLNRPDSAVRYYQLAIQANPANTTLPVKLSNAYYRQGNHFFITRNKPDSAVYYYKESIRLHPNSDMARFLYCGRAYLSIPKYDSALYYFKQGLHQHPDSTTLYLYIGKAYQGLKQYDSTEFYFKKLLRVDSLNTDGYVELGQFYKDRTQYDSAIYYYSRALQLKPDIKVLYNNLGFVYYKLSKWDSAIVYFRQAIAINPNSEPIRMNFANSFYNADRYDSSIIAYKGVLQINPKSEAALLSLGDAFTMLHQPDSAIYYYKEISKINIYNNMAYYKLAASYAVKKDKSNTLSFLEKAFKNGFKDAVLFKDDPSFDLYRNDQDFIKLVQQYLPSQ